MPYASTTFVTLPLDINTSILAWVGNLFTDLSPFVILIIGLPLGFWAVSKIIELVRAEFGSKS